MSSTAHSHSSYGVFPRTSAGLALLAVTRCDSTVGQGFALPLQHGYQHDSVPLNDGALVLIFKSTVLFMALT